VKTITAANRGEKSLVTPMLVGAGGPAYQGKPRHAEQPAHTLTTENHTALAAIHLTKFNTGSVGSAADEPGPTVTANSFIKRAGGAAPIGVVAASIIKMRGDPASHAPGHPVDEPGHTVSAQGTHHILLEGKLHKVENLRIPTFDEWFALTKDLGGTREEYDKLYGPDSPERERIAAFIAQHNGGAKGHQTYGHPVEKPISTLSSKCSQQQLVGAALIPYYGSEKDAVGTNEPSRTVTTRDRFGLVEAFGVVPALTAEQIAGAHRVAAFLRQHGIEVDGEFATVGEYVIVDIGMRMLKPRELYLAQGFPRSYIIDRGLYEDAITGRIWEERLTGTAQVKMCGNSVSPPMAEAIVAANNPEMRVEKIAA
jgi:DNA (cytosine-5)-methyltransferase 1